MRSQVTAHFSRTHVLLSQICALTRKDEPFCWSDGCEEAFERLKMPLTRAPVLAYPHFDREFLLETDASGVGLGVVLSQRQDDNTIRPMAFASMTLQPHERRYGISELEALGVVWAVKHFRHYLYSYPSTVYTDHEALRSLLNTPHPSGKLARWGMAIQELNLKIEYRPGKTNTRADALSRYPVSLLRSELIAALEANPPAKGGEGSTQEPLGKRQFTDPGLREMMVYLDTGKLPDDNQRARERLCWESLSIHFVMEYSTELNWIRVYASYHLELTARNCSQKFTRVPSVDISARPKYTVS